MPLGRTTFGAVTRGRTKQTQRRAQESTSPSLHPTRSGTAHAMSNKMAFSQITPEPFEDGDLRHYLRRFEKIATANGWNEEVSSSRLPVFLKGRASLIFDQIPAEKMTSWKATCELFTALFHPPQERLLWMRKFFDRQSHPEEPLEQLASDLKRYLQFSMPDTPLLQQDVLLKFQFLRSLPGDMIEKLEIHQHAMSFDDLVTKARLSLLERKSSSSTIAAIQPIAEGKPVDKPLAEKVVELEAEINRIRLQQGKCFKCGRPGHHAKDCRSNPAREGHTRRRFPGPPQGNGSGPRREW